MTNPPNNLKNILPDYSITTVVEYEYDWFDDHAEAYPSLDLSGCDIDCDMNSDGWCGNSNWSSWSGGSYGGNGLNNGNGELVDCAPIDEYIQELFDNINTAVYEDYDVNENMYYGSPSWSGWLYAHIVEDLGNENYQVDFEYGIMGSLYKNNYEPCIEWDADDFSTWKNQWDITLGGLFPEMTNGPFFNDFLSIDNDDWEEDMNEGCSDGDDGSLIGQMIWACSECLETDILDCNDIFNEDYYDNDYYYYDDGPPECAMDCEGIDEDGDSDDGYIFCTWLLEADDNGCLDDCDYDY